MKRIVTTVLALAVMGTGCSISDDGPDVDYVKRQLTSAQLRGFSSCEELEAQLKTSFAEQLASELRMQGESYHGGWRGGVDEVALDGAEMGDTGAADSAPSDSAAGSNEAGGREEGVDFSGTNNQEEGVDEADFVKTNGEYIYTLNGNRLHIFKVPRFGDLVHYSATEFEGHPTAMMLHGDKVVIYSRIHTWNLPEGHPVRDLVGQAYQDQWNYWYWRTSELTKVTVVDVADALSPQKLRHLYLEGSYQTGRKVDAAVRMVSYSWMEVPGIRTWVEMPDDYWMEDFERQQDMYAEAVEEVIEHNNAVIAGTALEDMVPRLYERLEDDQFIEHTFTVDGCQGFSIADDGNGRGFTSILSLDLFGDTFDFEADHLLTNPSVTYASSDTLVIAEPAQDWWWFWGNDDIREATNIHRFAISDGAATVYSGSGRIDGLILNQFSLSEHNDYIRVAATTGQWNRWWLEDPEPMNNHVYILAETADEEGVVMLDTVGHVGDIAPGERIWSSRFVGDEGYLVTFRQIDPLWTLDLSNPEQPEIKGELEIHGVSTYIHPLKDEQEGFLLTIGYGGDANGLDWNTQVSLFDVTNFTNPQLASALPMAGIEGDGWYYAHSEATHEHKACQYWAPRQLLAIPLSTYRYQYDEDARDYRYQYVSRLELIHVDTENGLSNYGHVDHSAFFNSQNDHWWNSRDVRRSIFMGDYIYAISDRGVSATNLDTLQLSAAYTLPGSVGGDYWDCWECGGEEIMWD
ncbi:MAG: beta-propeller domain-containing protein [Myxococcota bacterium]|nr:beta-propeller domain-containing protein [Myxococcota bacterium]